jgi:sec-independent protein translocase protein TatA
MIPEIGLPELLIILVIILLLFGPGRLAKAMGDLGEGLRSFKDAFSTEMKNPSSDEKPTSEEK